MQLKTILNRVLRHSAFVYVVEHLVETVAGSIEGVVPAIVRGSPL